MPNVDIDLATVLVAAVVNMVVGAIWYMPGVFGKEWSKLVGRKMSDMRKNAGPGYAITTLGALLQAWILAHFVAYSGATTALKGAMVGFWLWVGFVAITQGVNTVFSGGRKKLWAINTGYFLVVLVINGALFAAWR